MNIAIVCGNYCTNCC